MEVTINEQPFLLSVDTNLVELLSVYGLKSEKGIAIAVNNQVIPKSAWNQHALKANDNITVITASQGG